jgi:hypothetical protein
MLEKSAHLNSLAKSPGVLLIKGTNPKKPLYTTSLSETFPLSDSISQTPTSRCQFSFTVNSEVTFDAECSSTVLFA